MSLQPSFMESNFVTLPQKGPAFCYKASNSYGFVIRGQVYAFFLAEPLIRRYYDPSMTSGSRKPRIYIFSLKFADFQNFAELDHNYLQPFDGKISVLEKPVKSLRGVYTTIFRQMRIKIDRTCLVWCNSILTWFRTTVVFGTLEDSSLIQSSASSDSAAKTIFKMPSKVFKI